MPKDAYGRQLYQCTCDTQANLTDEEIVAWRVLHGSTCSTKDVNQKSVLKPVNGKN